MLSYILQTTAGHTGNIVEVSDGQPQDNRTITEGRRPSGETTPGGLFLRI